MSASLTGCFKQEKHHGSSGIIKVHQKSPLKSVSEKNMFFRACFSEASLTKKTELADVSHSVDTGILKKHISSDNCGWSCKLFEPEKHISKRLNQIAVISVKGMTMHCHQTGLQELYGQ